MSGTSTCWEGRVKDGGLRIVFERWQTVCLTLLVLTISGHVRLLAEDCVGLPPDCSTALLVGTRCAVGVLCCP